MVRYLVVLECFLIMLLVSPWFAARPGDSKPVKQAERSASPAPGVEAPERQSPEMPIGGALTPADRAILATELLGLPADAASSARETILEGNDGFATADVSVAPIEASSSAARKEPGLPAKNKQERVQAKQAATEDHSAPSPAMVAGVQRYLARLGYSPGAADGILGESTRRALAEYRRQTGSADVPISQALIARLRRDADRASARELRSRRIAIRQDSGYDPAPGWVATIAGGFQRLLGHEFDSEKQPGRIREYCRINRDSWIFDEGRGAFAYCGHMAAAR